MEIFFDQGGNLNEKKMKERGKVKAIRHSNNSFENTVIEMFLYFPTVFSNIILIDSCK